MTGPYDGHGVAQQQREFRDELDRTRHRAGRPLPARGPARGERGGPVLACHRHRARAQRRHPRGEQRGPPVRGAPRGRPRLGHGHRRAPAARARLRRLRRHHLGGQRVGRRRLARPDAAAGHPAALPGRLAGPRGGRRDRRRARPGRGPRSPEPRVRARHPLRHGQADRVRRRRQPGAAPGAGPALRRARRPRGRRHRRGRHPLRGPDRSLARRVPVGRPARTRARVVGRCARARSAPVCPGPWTPSASGCSTRRPPSTRCRSRRHRRSLPPSRTTSGNPPRRRPSIPRRCTPSPPSRSRAATRPRRSPRPSRWPPEPVTDLRRRRRAGVHPALGRSARRPRVAPGVARGHAAPRGPVPAPRAGRQGRPSPAVRGPPRAAPLRRHRAASPARATRVRRRHQPRRWLGHRRDGPRGRRAGSGTGRDRRHRVLALRRRERRPQRRPHGHRGPRMAADGSDHRGPAGGGGGDGLRLQPRPAGRREHLRRGRAPPARRRLREAPRSRSRAPRTSTRWATTARTPARSAT